MTRYKGDPEIWRPSSDGGWLLSEAISLQQSAVTVAEGYMGTNVCMCKHVEEGHVSHTGA